MRVAAARDDVPLVREGVAGEDLDEPVIGLLLGKVQAQLVEASRGPTPAAPFEPLSSKAIELCGPTIERSHSSVPRVPFSNSTSAPT